MTAGKAVSGQLAGSVGDEPTGGMRSKTSIKRSRRREEAARRAQLSSWEGGDRVARGPAASAMQPRHADAPSARVSRAPSDPAMAADGFVAPDRRPVARAVQGVRNLLHAAQQPAWGVASLITGTCRHVVGMVAGLSRRLFKRKHELLKVQVTVAGFPAVALVDSGATHSFVSSEWVGRHRVRPADMVGASGLQVQFGDGRSALVHQLLPRASVELGGRFRHAHKFAVCDIAEEVILGQDWLHLHNPQIDWAKGSMSLSRPHGSGRGVLVHSVTSAHPNGKHEQQPAFVVSHMRVKRLLKKQSTQAYLAWVKRVDSDAQHVLLQQAAVSPEGERPPPKPNIPGSGNPAVDALLERYSDVFQSPSGIPPLRGEEGHRINVEPGSSPVFRPGFRMNSAELAELHRQLQELTEKGWIRPSSSMYGAPVIFVRKASGEIRMCIDYRGLNKQTVRDRYPLPRVDELLDQLGGAAVYSKLDLASGYHQVCMHPDDVHKTAFNCRYGLFEWTVMPMGLTNAPSGFLRLMHKVFGKYLDKFMVVYLDDLLVYSKSVEEHVQHLELVLQALREQNLYAKASKCEFLKPELAFLGHVVSQEGIKVDPTKVRSVVDWPKPEDVHQLRSFMGLANYFRRFIRQFSRIAGPLTDKLQVSGSLRGHWGAPQEAAFIQLKQALVAAPVLHVADPNRPFIIQSDCSGFALGGVLLQEFTGGLHPIAFHSRKLNSAERNYSVHEREMLAIVECVKSWSHYIGGTSTTVHTDHRSLQHFWEQPKLQGRQTRWMECLQQHNVDIMYIKGETNVVADALSRRPDHMPAALGAIGVSSVVGGAESPLRREIVVAAGADPQYQQLVQQVGRGELRNHSLADGLVLHTDRRGSRVVVPASDELKGLILAEMHDAPSAGHLGHFKTFERVAALFEWPKMQADVKAYCRSCPACMASKAGTQKPAGLLQPLPVPDQKWQSVAMDFIVRLPVTEASHDALLVVTDRLTKLVRCIPTTTTVTAPEVAELFIDHIVRFYGLPQQIVSDRDSKFTSAFWQSLFKSLGTKLSMSSAYHPQTDGQSERSNQTVEQILRCYVSAYNTDWDKHLALAEFSLNSAVSVATGFSPFRLMYGYEPASPLGLVVAALQAAPGGFRHVEATAELLDRMAAELVQAQTSIQRAHVQAVVQANKHRRDVEYAVGDQVLLSTAHIKLAGTSRKFAPRWCGPFQVKNLVGNAAVELDLPSTVKLHPVVHVSQVKPFVVEGKWPQRTAPPPPILVDGEESYLVEAILKHRDVRKGPSRRHTVQYLVKWLGYPVWDCTWEPESNFPRDSEALLAYKSDNNLA